MGEALMPALRTMAWIEFVREPFRNYNFLSGR